MTLGGEIDQTAALLEQTGDAIDKDEVTQVIGAELRLEAILGLAERGAP